MPALLAVLALALELAAPARAADPATQDPAALSAAAESYLRAQLATVPGTATVTMDPVRAERLPSCQSLSPFISTPMRLRSRMSVGVRCAAPQIWTTYLQATVSVAGQYYVAAQPIAAGRIIQPDDLTPRDADLVALPADVILDPGLAIGKRTSSRLAPGQTVRANSLRSAQSIERGRTVNLVVRGPGFTVTSEGEALGNAAPGDRVQVRTPSGQIVSGVVRPSGQVEISM
jgi:flagella basal body P-ring formation protein FlgA